MVTTIAVTQADIDAARVQRQKPGDLTDTCPIAQALKRTYGVTQVRAHPDYLIVGDHWDGRNSVGTSRAIQRFMRNWDRYWKAEPARFRVQWR